MVAYQALAFAKLFLLLALFLQAAETAYPTYTPTSRPSCRPSGQPSRQPFSRPSSQPSRQPSAQPSRQPTRQPTGQPTRQPSSQPSMEPSKQPTSQPSKQPTRQPAGQPSRQPTSQPSKQPSKQPTSHPSRPSGQPTGQPTGQPSSQPSQPSGQPSSQPSAVKTRTTLSVTQVISGMTYNHANVASYATVMTAVVSGMLQLQSTKYPYGVYGMNISRLGGTRRLRSHKKRSLLGTLFGLEWGAGSSEVFEEEVIDEEDLASMMEGKNKKEEEQQQASVTTHLRRGLSSTSSMVASYIVSVNSASTTAASLQAQISADVSSGQFNALLNVLSTAYGVSDMASASSASISFISLVPTALPTMAPSPSPTPNTGLAWLQNNYIAWSVVAGIVGVMIIYCIYRCIKRYNEKCELELEKLDHDIQIANEKLAKKYEAKNETTPAPHISKMRENFKKQYGREVSTNSNNKTKNKNGDNDYSEYPEQDGNIRSTELPSPSFRNPGGSGSPGKGTAAKGRKFPDFDDRDEEEGQTESFEKKITSITANELRALVKELLSKNASLRVGGMQEREVNSKIYTLIEGKGKLPPKDIAILQRLATEVNTENEKFEASLPPPPPPTKKKATKTSTATTTATAASSSGTKKSKEAPSSPTSPSTPAETKKFGFGVTPAANPLGPGARGSSKGPSRSQSAGASPYAGSEGASGARPKSRGGN